jgi:hypothetical protein
MMSIYHRLLRLYPLRFRAEYGRAMAQAFRDRCRAAYGRHGTRALLRAAAAGLLDAAANGVLERISRTSDVSVSHPVRVEASRALRVSEAGKTFVREMRTAARRLVREPTFTVAVVCTLALGIGAATTVFSVVHAVLLQPLPYRDAGRIVTLRDTASSPPVVVVNETMARRAWPGENPIGKRIRSSLSTAGAAVREVVASSATCGRRACRIGRSPPTTSRTARCPSDR